MQPQANWMLSLSQDALYFWTKLREIQDSIHKSRGIIGNKSIVVVVEDIRDNKWMADLQKNQNQTNEHKHWHKNQYQANQQRLWGFLSNLTSLKSKNLDNKSYLTWLHFGANGNFVWDMSASST